ncbi:MAG: tyrosine-type recombinase/integrase, partial [Terriglobia bacterium]
ESRGMNETAHRALQRCGQIFRYAIATGRATRDITSDLRGALAPIVVENRAAITEPVKIGALLRAIDDYIGHPATLIALKLSPLVFLRPSELRAAEWSEVDLQTAEWRVPAARMKIRERHIVPLASQAVAILCELRSVTGKGRYLFPSLRTSDRPMSVNTVNAALRRLGYARDEMTGHGFRAMACTCLNELGWHPDLIELQMAHAERNKVRAAYNRAERLADRRKMMQAWADYLDGLRTNKRESAVGGMSVSRGYGTVPMHNSAEKRDNPRKHRERHDGETLNWSYSQASDWLGRHYLFSFIYTQRSASEP